MKRAKSSAYVIKQHEIVIIIAVLVIGIIVGSHVLARSSASSKPACSDGKDNDGDNKVDFPADPGCSAKSDKSELNSIDVQCDNGIDDDGDTLRDYPVDTGCDSLVDVSERGSLQCDDGIDNDGDTKIDYPNDAGCNSPSDNSEADIVQCNDGVDNDNDTQIDYPNDVGCSSSADTSERGTTQCDDGMDNDNDTKIDYPNDAGCLGPGDNDETDPITSMCGDGVCSDPSEYYGNCLSDCASPCGDNICGSNEDINNCYTDCQYIRFGEGLATTLRSVQLPGDTKFTNVTFYRQVINGVGTSNMAFAVHKLRSYGEVYDPNNINAFNANVTTDDEWVLRAVQLVYNSSLQKYKSGNQYHYFAYTFDYSNYSKSGCVNTDGYFDGQRVHVRSKTFTTDVDNTCPFTY